MLFKLATLTLVLPFVSALTFNTPKNLVSGGSATITWSSAAGDPSTFSIELLNIAFHNSYAIANNVFPSSGTITLNLPIVPGGAGYTLEAVDISNITNIYATSGAFSIGATGSTISSSTTSSKSGGSKTSSMTVNYTPPAASSSFGKTVAASSVPAATGSSTDDSSNTFSASSGAASPTSSSSITFNAGSSMKFAFNAGSGAAALLSVVVGATIFAL